MTEGETDLSRTIWALSGQDALNFLQGLVSNDLRALETGPGIVWAAFLTPQGKYLADFFVIRTHGGTLLIDIASVLAPATLRRLSMYRLRADATITHSPLQVRRGLGTVPEGALPDPRHSALGWRAWTEATGAPPSIDWDRIRVDHVIPESGIELVPDESYILENGFERLNGVDFRKGCYVGQEVTARMKHKTDLRKGLVRVAIVGAAPVGTAITAGNKAAGTLFTQSGRHALAYLRLDRIDPPLLAGSAVLAVE